jgi:regulator of protease activity HflC (stomatin/prohibitin superfamily)
MSELLGFTFIAVIALGMIYTLKRIMHVRAGYVVVTRWWRGSVARELKEGWHLLGLTEFVITYRWTYTDQTYTQRVEEGHEMRVANALQIDMVPFECKTNDGKSVVVDTMFTWHVFNPTAAACTAPDVLQLLCQQIISQIRNQVAHYKEANLTRNEREIAALACKAIANDWTPKYGLEVVTCEVQNISADDETVRFHRNRRNGLQPHDIARIEHAHALSTAPAERRTLVNVNTQ